LKITDKKIKNAILNELEIADNIVCLKSFPRVLTISLTEKCNLQCRMCSQNKKNRKQELSERQVNNVIKLFPFLEKVLWVGGEVFLYNGFESLMDLAHKYNVQQNITSNGLLITENYAKKIVDYGVELNLSIDSVNKEVYEFIRVGSNFEVLLKNIKNIKYYRSQKEKNSNLMLNVVLSKWNFDVKNNFSDIMIFAKEYGFDGVNIYQDAFEKNEDVRRKIIDSFNMNLNNLIKLSNDLKIKLNNLVYPGYKHMIEFQKENKEEQKLEDVAERKDCDLFENMMFQERKFDIKDDIVLSDYDYSNMRKNIVGLKQQIKKCLLPWKKLYISYSGDIFVECHCPNLVQLKTENIKFSNTEKVYNDIIEIWNSKELIENRQAVVENGLKCMKNCYLNDEYRKPIGLR
jgi:MoaA/NifB/PqqE/SkfB family radical SAM enzyme